MLLAWLLSEFESDGFLGNGECRTLQAGDEIRYRAGSVALQAWLDAQERRRQAEVALAENRLSRLQNFTTLCQALGGAPGVEGPDGVSSVGIDFDLSRSDLENLLAGFLSGHHSL
jgi:hypothetical protein